MQASYITPRDLLKFWETSDNNYLVNGRLQDRDIVAMEH